MSKKNPPMDSLTGHVFNLIRKRHANGRRDLDGEVLFHKGERYGLNVDVPLQLELLHVTADRLDEQDRATRGQRSFAVLILKRAEASDVNGMALMHQAMVDGQAIEVDSDSRAFYVLDPLPVPIRLLRMEDPDDSGNTLH